MASGPYPDPRRGTWTVQWFDGLKWRRTTVVRKRPGWEPGKPMPVNPPPEAKAALAEFIKREETARKRKGYQPDRTVADFLQSYLDGYDVGREPGSKGEATKAAAVFRAWCEANRLKTIGQVTPEACHRWMADRAATRGQRTGKPLAHATLKKERALLATAWAEALRRGQVDGNPWIAVEVPGKPNRKKRGSWKPEEFERLLTACNPWLRDFLIVGCHTGLRVEALRGIEWRDIQPAADGRGGLGHLIVRPELDKTGKGYKVPIHARTHDVFIRRFIHNRGDHDRILTGMRGRPLSTSNITDRAIRRACKKAGLDPPDSPNHHCRRTFGRWAVIGHLTGRPVPMYIVSRWLGHSSLAMTMTYLDVTEDDSSAWMMGEDDPAMTSM